MQDVQWEVVSTPKREKKLPKFLYVDEVLGVLGRSPPGLNSWMPGQAILEVLYGTGIRVGELVALSTSSVGYGRGKLKSLGERF
ncbi:MAG: hypothetical protein ACOX1X_09400 [Dethiobacteria bacterium]